MTSIALVLGGGGLVGSAYEIGVLAALADETGWDARDADLIVGTSAGASVAATLRSGYSPADHFAHATDGPLSPEGEALDAGLPNERLRLPEPPARVGLPVPMALWLLPRATLRRGPARPALALAGLLPAGSLDPSPLSARVRHVSSVRWPQSPTWLCAVRLRDGSRVVFGRDDVDVDLATAVEASCAIAGYFAPVPVGPHRYVDGGLWSVTNADLVAGLGFDLAVVVSPLAVVPSGPTWSPHRIGRQIYAGNLERERREIRRRGTPVLDLGPDPHEAERLGRESLDHDRVPDAARIGRDAARRHLVGPDAADAVLLLHDSVAQRRQRSDHR
jgi:NTE family protein